MKCLLMALTALVALAAADSEAAVVHYRSGYRRSPSVNVYAGRAPRAYSYRSGYRTYNAPRRGFFSQMMELERRKNAALRNMFWGN